MRKVRICTEGNWLKLFIIRKHFHTTGHYKNKNIRWHRKPVVFKYLVCVEGKGYKRGLWETREGKKEADFFCMVCWLVDKSDHIYFCVLPWLARIKQRMSWKGKRHVLDSQTRWISSWWLSYTQSCTVLSLWLASRTEKWNTTEAEIDTGIASMFHKVHELQQHSVQEQHKCQSICVSSGNTSQCCVNFWTCIIIKRVKSTWKEHIFFLKGFPLMVLVESTLLYRHVFVVHSV